MAAEPPGSAGNLPGPAGPARNWFEQGGRAYSAFRPGYPAALAEALAALAPDRESAVDVGCGNGQFTTLLARHFRAVTGLDPSAGQLASAAPQRRVRYLCAPAEALPLPDRCATLLTAAQAAHWFDLPRFYAEVRRVVRPGGLVALIGYGVLRIGQPGLDACHRRFYEDALGPWWPPQRRLVEAGYADIPFPFDELPAPGFAIEVDWSLQDFLGYLTTWSAVRRAAEAGQGQLAERFAQELTRLWQPAEARQRITWPIRMRLGRL